MKSWTPMGLFLSFLSSLSLLSLSLASSAGAAPQYYIVDLGTVTANTITAKAVNESGDVAGSVRVGFLYHSFSIIDGVFVDHGTLAEGPGYSYGSDVNDSDESVGQSSRDSGAARGFVYSQGVMTELGVLAQQPPQGNQFSRAVAINNGGQIAGTSANSNYDSRAFVTIDGVMTDLGTLGGDSSRAFGINELGEVVGQSRLANSAYRGFYMVDGVMTSTGLFPGDTHSRANGNNDLGHSVGRSYVVVSPGGGGFPITYEVGTAFLNVGGVMTDLGTLPGAENSEASGINNQGQIIGTSDRTAFYYDDEVGMIELASLVGEMGDWIELIYGYDINEQGVVVGVGRRPVVGANTPYRSFLLIPVPEPSTGGGLLAGCVGLVLLRTRHTPRRKSLLRRPC